MDNREVYIRGVFGALSWCASDLGWERDDLEALFGKLADAFSTTDDISKDAWTFMLYTIMESSVYNEAILRNKEDEENEENVQSEEINIQTSRRTKGSYLSKHEPFEEKLLKIDERYDGSRFVWIAQTKYCGPDIHNKDNGEREAHGKKEKFEKLIKEIDIGGKIKRLFCHIEDGQKRERWIFNAIDSEKFMEELNNMDEIKRLSDGTEIYNRYCKEGEWKKYRKKMFDLVKSFSYTKKSKHILDFDTTVRTLSELVPVIYFTENGERKIKDYARWKNERRIIKEVLSKKLLGLEIDLYEEKAFDLVHKCFQKIEDINTYTTMKPDIKKKLLSDLNDICNKIDNKVLCINGIRQ